MQHRFVRIEADRFRRQIVERKWLSDRVTLLYQVPHTFDHRARSFVIADDVAADSVPEEAADGIARSVLRARPKWRCEPTRRPRRRDRGGAHRQLRSPARTA